MTKQEFLQVLYAQMGGKPALPEPFLVGMADIALKILTKEIIYSGSPLVTSWLAPDSTEETGTLSIGEDPKLGFTYVDVPSSFIKTGDRLHLVTYIKDGDKFTVEPAKSWIALETMPAKHGKAYYKLHDNTLYFKFQLDAEEEEIIPDDIYVEHYKYPSLENFPYELVDLLAGKVISMLAPKQEVPVPQPNAPQQ